MIRILHPGSQSIIQDLGRYGYQSLGFSSGGPADRFAHSWANLLVGNNPQAATIEMILQPGEFYFEQDTWASVTGAVESVWVGDDLLPSWSGFWVEQGSIVRLNKFYGIYAYLGIQGGIAVEPVMGSRSTDLVAGIGGFFGRRLEKGDNIPVLPTAPKKDWPYDEIRLVDAVPKDNLSPIRVLPGPRKDLLKDHTWKGFLSQDFIIGLDSNRMGIRLKTHPVLSPIPPPVLSEGMMPGAIELTPEGSLLLLLSSRGTLGGYPVIAIVISVDLNRVAQRQLGTAIKFKLTSVEQARKLWQAEKDFICEKRIIWHKRYRKGHPKDSRFVCFHLYSHF